MIKMRVKRRLHALLFESSTVVRIFLKFPERLRNFPTKVSGNVRTHSPSQKSIVYYAVLSLASFEYSSVKFGSTFGCCNIFLL